jgi:hypothetical protein
MPAIAPAAGDPHRPPADSESSGVAADTDETRRHPQQCEHQRTASQTESQRPEHRQQRHQPLGVIGGRDPSGIVPEGVPAVTTAIAVDLHLRVLLVPDRFVDRAVPLQMPMATDQTGGGPGGRLRLDGRQPQVYRHREDLQGICVALAPAEYLRGLYSSPSTVFGTVMLAQSCCSQRKSCAILCFANGRLAQLVRALR